MTVHELRPPKNERKFRGSVRPSDLKIVFDLETVHGCYSWVLDPKETRKFAGDLMSLAYASERLARARTPKPRWLLWINEADAHEIAREAKLSASVAARIVLNRTTRVISSEWDHSVYPPKRTDERAPRDPPVFTHVEEVERVDGVGEKAMARIIEAGTRLRPPHAELAPVVGLAQAKKTNRDRRNPRPL